MYILHVATEIAPLAKVGGLSDMIYGLTRQLEASGHAVEVALPYYSSLDLSKVTNLRIAKTVDVLDCPTNIWSGVFEGIPLLFFDPQAHDYFKRERIYGYKDDTDRFLFFSTAVHTYLETLDDAPDVIHLHDWHTAAIASMHRSCSRIVFTIHNLSYQGKCCFDELKRYNIEPTAALTDDADPSLANLMKGGIVNCDVVTTVSPTYAEEILTPVFGEGLEKTLFQHRSKLTGILNGIDPDYWNPEIDPHLPHSYSSRSLLKKREVKKVLRARLGLSDSDRPLIGCITRLAPQKGLELIEYAIESVDQLGGQLIFLGADGISSIDKKFLKLQKKHANHPHVKLILERNEALAHLIYGGVDMMLVPSLFEPCGLVQMIAMRYGALPVVHATGGLKDTVSNIDGKPSPDANGFVFTPPTKATLTETLTRAITLWNDNPALWQQLMQRAMEQGWSWDGRCEEYEAVYRKAEG